MFSFATAAPISAVLDVPAGRVHLVAADRADTTVDVQPADPAKNRDVRAAEQTIVSYANGALRVELPTKNQYFGPSGNVQVTVQLPAGSRVRAVAASTELRTTGQLGDVVFEGAYQRISVESVASLRLTAVDGDVEIGHLGGQADISTARGDIRIAEAVRGMVVLSTQSGSISIGAAAGVSAALDAGTSHGRVSNALKNNGVTELEIHATTPYGDITARSL